MAPALAQVVRRLAKGCEPLPGYGAGDGRAAQEGIEEVLARAKGVAAGGIDLVVGALPAEHGGEPHHHRLGHDEPAGAGEVAPHRIRVDHEARQEGLGLGERP